MPEQTIHILSPAVANQIAAGEVVERPASVVKELVENSLDAGAGHIAVRIEQAGKKLIVVDDDGCGMSAADAELALQRHATSKIASAGDLHAIASNGFRGEALPSIASVSRLRLHSCLAGGSEGTEVTINAQDKVAARPAPPRHGTRVEVRDLFLNTPARLRFLRTDRTEEAVLVEAVRALALANPGIAMHLQADGRTRLHVHAGETQEDRVARVIGREFVDNSISFGLEHESVGVRGRFGLPTFHHRDGSRIHFIVNGRVVKDRQLLAALRAGYRDVMFHDRFPVAVVYIEMDPREVDVNVHPSKREVRFRQPRSVRAAIVSCVRVAIERMGRQVSSTTSLQALKSMQARHFPPSQRPAEGQGRLLQQLFSAPHAAEPVAAYEADAEKLQLGQPLAQLHRCYILAQTGDGVVLVDQHAAAERIAYEKLKLQLQEGEIPGQMLLTPVNWQPDARVSAWLHDHAGTLSIFGVHIEPVGEESFVVRAVPAMLSDESPQSLVAELVEAVMSLGVDVEGRGRVFERWLGNHACRHAVKSGRILKPEEQEALLRQMEKTPNIAQCNHGRPTYVRLSLNDLDRLFGRKE